MNKDGFYLIKMVKDIKFRRDSYGEVLTFSDLDEAIEYCDYMETDPGDFPFEIWHVWGIFEYDEYLRSTEHGGCYKVFDSRLTREENKVRF
jgi:hypothetical protein